MAATELSSRLRAATGLPLSPTLVFEQPTPRAIAAHIMEQMAVNDSYAAMTPSDKHQPCPQAPLGAFGHSGARALRCLMLHGQAASGELQQRVLEATGWNRLGIHFVCIDGPEVVPPRPELFLALQNSGMYNEPSYRAWGLHETGSESAVVEASVAHVERLMVSHGPIDGVAGICDGAIIAAIATEQGRTRGGTRLEIKEPHQSFGHTRCLSLFALPAIFNVARTPITHAHR